MSNASDIAIMLDDLELINLVSSWPKMTKEQRENMQDVADIANIPQRTAHIVVKRAKAHGLVFDNGEVNDYAQRYINSIVATRLKTMQGKNANASRGA